MFENVRSTSSNKKHIKPLSCTLKITTTVKLGLTVSGSISDCTSLNESNKFTYDKRELSCQIY